MRNFLLGIVAVLIVGGIGAGAYLYGRLKQGSLSKDTSFTLHYPVASPTTQIEQPGTGIGDQISLQQSANDNELIRQTLFKKNGWKESDGITVTVNTDDGKYASGTADSSGGGGMWFAAKVNGNWQIVWDGNGSIRCSDLTNYPDFPTKLIPQCWNDQTQKSIKR